MPEKYPFQEVEAKWQKWWEANGTYRAKNPDQTEAEKFYGLVEFPYPSGEGLHVGHPRSYTAIDIMTRKERMEGRNVLYPMGWDAFGLPAENFAIKNKKHPAEFTAKNVANFKRQIKMLGAGFDWEREVNTTDPGYYKWTQWMFIRFFESWYDEKLDRARPIATLSIPAEVEAQGEAAVREYRDSKRLAFKTKTTINWCPKDKIGLANEEAAGGVCDRCGGPVEKRVKEQWMLRITAYSERLINDLSQVDYLEKIKTSQINWIGRSEGAIVKFRVSSFESQVNRTPPLAKGETKGESIEVFTTRPDTLFGATYMVLAPEHPLIKNLCATDASAFGGESRISNFEEVKKYQEKAAKRSDLERQENKEKTGVRLEGVTAVNPATEKEIPIWIADYVLPDYGTGAIMAVPAHDERDFEFAKKFELPVAPVVMRPAEGVAGIGVMLRTSEGRYLLQKRDANTKKNPEMIAPFGGGLEKGESVVECAIREMKEELSLKLTAGDLKFIGEFESRNTPGSFLAMFVADNVDPSSLSLHEGESVVELDGARALTDKNVTEFTKSVLKTIGGAVEYLPYCEAGTAINSGFLDGLDTSKAKDKMIAWLEKGGMGERKVTYRQKDWVFSRQRYWGEPIPMVHCDHCGWAPLNDSQLPLLLPDVQDYEPTDSGDSPLAAMTDWVKTVCPICGAEARRETDTMPGWAGSSWYFMRYCDPKNTEAFASADALKYWMPVDLYNGGMEHTTLHLLYSRFWYKFLFDMGFVPESCGSEPYKVRRSHAMILGEGGIKMSKSKGNVVNPDDVINEYGSDVFRMYEMFIGPYDMDAPWSTQGIVGVKRFLEKVWNVGKSTVVSRQSSVETLNPEPRTPNYERLLHYSVKKVGEDIDGMHFNTAVSQLMILTNELAGQEMELRDFEAYLKILAPFAPHIAEELWHEIGHEDSIHVAPWPVYDPEKTKSQTATVAVQVNGKVRGEIQVDVEAEEASVLALAQEDENVKKYLAGKKVKKAIYVKGKIVSLVV